MSIREEIVAEAMTWIDTPYHDHAGLKGCGVDCAYFPLRVYQKFGKIPLNFKPPKYSPQQWLNSPSQTDRRKLKIEDRTFFNIVTKFARYELKTPWSDEPSSGLPLIEAEPKPGDFVIYKMVASWTHGAIIVNWPDYVLHPVIDRGIMGSHGTNEGFWKGRAHRFFTVLEPGE